MAVSPPAPPIAPPPLPGTGNDDAANAGPAPATRTTTSLPARRQATGAAQAPRRPGSGIGLLVALLAVGVSVLVLAPLTISALRRTQQEEVGTPSVTVHVSAESGFRFSPSEIRVPRGATVQVDFSDDDLGSPHDFQTLGQAADARVVAWPGETHTFYFRAARTPGRYAFICTLRGHRDAGMTGVIVVE